MKRTMEECKPDFDALPMDFQVELLAAIERLTETYAAMLGITLPSAQARQRLRVIHGGKEMRP